MAGPAICGFSARFKEDNSFILEAFVAVVCGDSMRLSQLAAHFGKDMV